MKNTTKEQTSYKSFSNYEDWFKIANSLGWVHVHDTYVVCDDPDSDFIIGEWDNGVNTGWLFV